MADKNSLNLKVNLDLSDLKSKMQELERQLETIGKASRKFDKSVENSFGNSANGNATGALIDSSELSRQLAESLSSAMKDAFSERNELSHRSMNDPQAASKYSEITSVMSRMASLLSRTDSMGIKTIPGTSQSEITNPTVQQAQQMQSEGKTTRQSRGTGTPTQNLEAQRSAREATAEITEMVDQIKKSAKQANSDSSHAGQIVNTATDKGHMSTNKANTLGRYMENGSSIDEQMRSAQDAKNRITENISSMPDQGQRSVAQDKEMQNYLKLDSTLDDVIKSLTNSKTAFDSLNKSVETSTSDSGQTTAMVNGVSMDPDRGSMRAMFEQRKAGIIIGAGARVQNAISSGYQSGQQARLAAQDNVNSITFTQAAGGKNLGNHADNALLTQLGDTGINNGTGYNSTDMAQFAGTFVQNGGNSNQAVGAADAMSRFSRYTGAGTDTTNQLFNALGQSGAVDSTSDARQVSQTIMGEINRSGMQGRSGEQVQGLTSVISGMQSSGITLNKSDVNQLSAFQGVLAKNGGTALQGAGGSDAMQKLSSGMGSAFSNPLMRTAFAGNNPKYAGAQGYANLQLDMANGLKHSSQVGSMIKNLQNMNGGNKTLTASAMSQQFGLTGDQARGLVKAENSGKLSQNKLDSIVNKDQNKGKQVGKHLSKQFSTQGNSTLDIKVAINQEGEITASNIGDSARKGMNATGKQGHGVGSFFANAVGGAMSQFVGFAGGNLMLKGGGKLLSAIGGTRMGRGVTSLFKKGAGKLSNVRGFGWLGKFGKGGKDTEEAAGDLSKAADAAKDTGKAATAAKDASKVGGLGAMFKGAGSLFKKFGGKAFEKLGLKTAGKLGAKAIPFLGWGLTAIDAARGAGDIAKDPGNALMHPLKSVGSLLGLDRVNAKKPGIFSPVKAHAATKKKNGKTDEQVITDANGFVHNLKVQLDHAERVIAKAKKIKIIESGNSSDSSNDNTSNDNTNSGTTIKDKGEKKNLSSVAAYLKKQYPKATPQGIAAVLGNWDAESKMEPNATYSAKNPKSAYGLGQWLGGRRSNLESYARKHHERASSISTQVDFALHGDGSNSKILKSVLSGDSSVTDLAGYFYDKWERGHQQYRAGHVSNASSVFNTLKKKHATGGIYSQPHIGEVAEEGTEAVIPMGAGREGTGKSLLKQAAGMMGMSLGLNQSQSSANNSMSFAPNYQIHVGNADNPNQVESQLRNVMSDISQQSRAALNEQYRKFFAMNMKLS